MAMLPCLFNGYPWWGVVMLLFVRNYSFFFFKRYTLIKNHGHIFNGAVEPHRLHPPKHQTCWGLIVIGPDSWSPLSRYRHAGCRGDPWWTLGFGWGTLCSQREVSCRFCVSEPTSASNHVCWISVYIDVIWCNYIQISLIIIMRMYIYIYNLLYNT